MIYASSYLDVLKVFLSKTEAKFLTIEFQNFPKGWISAIKYRDFAMILFLQVGKYLKICQKVNDKMKFCQ